MIDSYNREWTSEENDLDKFCKIHRLTHIVNYEINTLYGSHLKATHLEEGEVFVSTQVLKEGDGMKHYIVDMQTKHPVSDDYVLSHLKKYFREKHLKELGI